MFITKSEFNELVTLSVRYVASKLKLRDLDLKSNTEIANEIKLTNHALYEKLLDFLNTYKKWYTFHLFIEKNDKQGKLNSNERNKLDKLIYERDLRRKELIQLIAKLKK